MKKVLEEVNFIRLRKILSEGNSLFFIMLMLFLFQIFSGANSSAYGGEYIVTMDSIESIINANEFASESAYRRLEAEREYAKLRKQQRDIEGQLSGMGSDDPSYWSLSESESSLSDQIVTSKTNIEFVVMDEAAFMQRQKNLAKTEFLYYFTLLEKETKLQGRWEMKDQLLRLLDKKMEIGIISQNKYNEEKFNIENDARQYQISKNARQNQLNVIAKALGLRKDSKILMPTGSQFDSTKMNAVNDEIDLSVALKSNLDIRKAQKNLEILKTHGYRDRVKIGKAEKDLVALSEKVTEDFNNQYQSLELAFETAKYEKIFDESSKNEQLIMEKYSRGLLSKNNFNEQIIMARAKASGRSDAELDLQREFLKYELMKNGY